MISNMLHNLPKKGLKIAHINICSLRNKLSELTDILQPNNLHILGVSETHVDSTFDDATLMIDGYSIFRNDRNIYGGGVASTSYTCPSDARFNVFWY